MTMDTFYAKFVPNFRLDTKALIEHITNLEAELYEKSEKIEELESKLEQFGERHE